MTSPRSRSWAGASLAASGCAGVVQETVCLIQPGIQLNDDDDNNNDHNNDNNQMLSSSC